MVFIVNVNQVAHVEEERLCQPAASIRGGDVEADSGTKEVRLSVHVDGLNLPSA